jgi:hypothetical protein
MFSRRVRRQGGGGKPAAETEVAPVSWTPDYLCSRSPQWPRQEGPTHLSSVARWWNWCMLAAHLRNWRKSSNRRRSRSGIGRRADRSACHCAVVARYSRSPLRVAALRRNSREIVEAVRPSRRATSRTEQPCTRRSAISSRSTNERYRPDNGFADGRNIAGGMPPAFRNNLVPTACDIPAPTAASSLAMPAAIAAQKRRCSSRPATTGRPGENNGARPDPSERRLRFVIATAPSGVATIT